MKLFTRKFGSGRPIVILHGLFGSSDNWQTFAKALSGFGYHVITADLRNHGQSPQDDSFNYQVLAQDVEELIATEKLTKPLIVGHSMGGKTALQLGFTNPGLLSGLIIVDIAPRFYPVHHREILDALQSVDINSLKSRGDAEMVLRQSIQEEDVIQFLMKNLYRKEKDQFDWRFNLAAINAQIENVGEELKFNGIFPLPTLFIKGERSSYISYEDEKAIFEQFGDVEIQTAPGAGHWVHAEAAEWTLETMLKWITDKKL
ncbi:MAG: alpha/beta fold hydrolase [Bacteroidia bacterium]|nr:alpha/beta fold hydrolase [Bacteroidia bacterium]